MKSAKELNTQILKNSSRLRSEEIGTVDVAENSTLHRRIQKSIAREDRTTFTGGEVLLVIRGIVENVKITAGQSVVLGRADVTADSDTFVDLTPYGAQERGVSRNHARLSLQDNGLYVTDLGSANGTYVNGQRLLNDVPQQLHTGAGIILGRLPVAVLFE